jgi:hypothetical protein
MTLEQLLRDNKKQNERILNTVVFFNAIMLAAAVWILIL